MSFALAAAVSAPSTRLAGAEPSQRPYRDMVHRIPGKIEVEHYDEGGQGVAYHDTVPGNSGGLLREDGVDIVPRENGGHAVGWCSGGEWLEYTVNVEPGVFDIEVRAGTEAYGELSLSLGVIALGRIPIWSTGSYNNHRTWLLRNVQLRGGKQILRIEMAGDEGLYDIDWLRFRPSDNGVKTRSGFLGVKRMPFGAPAALHEVEVRKVA